MRRVLVLCLAVLPAPALGQGAIRDVSPPGVTQIYRPGGGWAAPAEEAPAAVTAPRPAEPVLASLPFARLSPEGLITRENLVFKLRGVRLPDRRLLCPGEGGQAWACGVTAFVQWSNAVRRNDLRCDLADKPIGASVDCRLGDTDLATQLLRNGWALLDDTEPLPHLPAALAEAQSTARGIWRHPPATARAEGE